MRSKPLLGLLLLAGCERVQPPVAPQQFGAFTSDSGSGRIAFVSDRDGNNEIYVMNADGSGVTRLTDTPAADGDPAWSPDGTRLAFTSTRDGNSEIYVMNADGSGVTRLTSDPNRDGHPAWCGTRIAFQSDRYLPPFYDIYVMNDDGTGPTRLTITNASSDEYPAWSPSCSRIAYSYDANSSTASINAMNADGSGNHTVISGAGQNNSPAWSPDGTRLAFTSRRDADQPPVPLEIREIYVVNADGSETRVTHTDVNAWNVQPTWSPDGTQIAFQSNRDGRNAIYVINADGTNLTRLTSDSAGDAQPAWFAIANPPPNQPPVANFSSSCSRLTCSFYNMSSDPDGWIVAYSWTFGDSGTSTVPNPSHTYGSGGRYTVTLTVTDNQGATNSVSHAVTVAAPNRPPVAGFTSSCSGLSCAFTSTSTDPDGSITVYHWTLGDGNTSTAQNPSHTYAPGCTYSVPLTVTDNQGATNSASNNVTVPPPPPPSGRIAFVSNRDGNSEIYVMNGDGTGLTRLTDDPGVDVYPAWSPDGSRIAFTSTRDGHYNIYVMNADGSAVTQLTTSTGSVGSHAPARRGTQIAHMSRDYIRPFSDVYVMNDDGTGQTRLTLANAAFDQLPSCPPTCAQIAFTKDPGGRDQVYVMNADGSGVTQLTSGSYKNSHPASSPDGSRIAVVSDRDWVGNSTEIYVMNTDGTQQTRLTGGAFHAFHLYAVPPMP